MWESLLSAKAGVSAAGGSIVAAAGPPAANAWRKRLLGGNPFANARWEEAWKVAAVDALAWDEIRNGLREETQRWLKVLESPREVSGIELAGLISSVAHLAYHVGAIRQISKTLRGPKEGTFQP
jgi:hypothetical protein